MVPPQRTRSGIVFVKSDLGECARDVFNPTRGENQNPSMTWPAALFKQMR
jgi:hypothetical protein